MGAPLAHLARSTRRALYFVCTLFVYIAQLHLYACIACLVSKRCGLSRDVGDRATGYVLEVYAVRACCHACCCISPYFVRTLHASSIRQVARCLHLPVCALPPLRTVPVSPREVTLPDQRTGKSNGTAVDSKASPSASQQLSQPCW